MGINIGPKSIGSLHRTKNNWLQTKTQRDLGPDDGPSKMSLDAGPKVNWFYVWSTQENYNKNNNIYITNNDIFNMNTLSYNKNNNILNTNYNIFDRIL
jgi:hypothetical protein